MRNPESRQQQMDVSRVLSEHGLHSDRAAVAKRLTEYRPIIAALAQRQLLEAMTAGHYYADYSKPDDVEMNLSFSHDQSGLDENVKEKYYQDKLKGKVLVDIGAGKESHIRQLARNFAVAVLIEIEKFYPNKETGWANVSADQLEIVRVQADILETLARLPDASVNVTMSGMEKCVTERQDDYREAILREIARVVPTGGIFFGHQSDIWEAPAGFTRKTFRDNEHTGIDGKFFSFERQR